MTALNKQALREAANAANIASWGKWESYKPHKGARGYEVKVGAKAVAQHCLKANSVFIAAANPATVLALLDEMEAKDKRNAEMEDILEDEIKLWMQRYDSANNRREAAEKRIAEHNFENRLLANADRDIKALRLRIAELEREPIATLDVQSGRADGNKFALVYSSAAHKLPDDVYYLCVAAAGIGVKGK